MHKFGSLSMSQAREIINAFDSLSSDDFNLTVSSKWEQLIIDEELNEYDLSVRERLVSVFKAHYKADKNDLYPLDLNMGIAIYEILNPNNSEFTVSDACDDDMWRYITIKIIPDLTHVRYPASNEKGANNINKNRFFANTRRIWIKSLWWYVHLSWQGNSNDTYSVLKDNGVDNINKLIETPGKGYRLSLYRTLMKAYSERQHNTKYFAGVTKLNNAKSKTIEPLLYPNGELAYVKILLDEVPLSVGKEEKSDVKK